MLTARKCVSRARVQRVKSTTQTKLAQERQKGPSFNARGRVFPAVRRAGVREVAFSDCAGTRGEPEDGQHAAYRAEPAREAETLGDTRVVFIYYLERCVTAGNSETEIPEDDLVHFPDACP